MQTAFCVQIKKARSPGEGGFRDCCGSGAPPQGRLIDRYRQEEIEIPFPVQVDLVKSAAGDGHKSSL